MVDEEDKMFEGGRSTGRNRGGEHWWGFCCDYCGHYIGNIYANL